MKHESMRGGLWRLVLLTFYVLFVCPTGACTSSAPESDTGSAELIGSTREALSASDVTRVVVTVTGAGIATPLVQSLVRVGGRWQGTIGGIPAGSGRSFHGDAFDASSTVIYTGDATNVTIGRGTTALVGLLLQQVRPPPPFANESPRIDSVASASNTVAPGDTVRLSAAAHDPNPGDHLTFAWSSTAGTFTDAHALLSAWTSPAFEGPQTLELRVTDDKGAFTAVSFQVQVSAAGARGRALVSATFNTWPEVRRVVATPGRIDVGESTGLSVSATDADGNALRYAWTSSCPGSFDDPTARTPRFTLTSAPSSSCTLTVRVDDQAGGANTGSIGIALGAAPGLDLAPVVDATFQSTDWALEGDLVTLRVDAHDPDGTPVTVGWSTTHGTIGAGMEPNEATWTAPACAVGLMPTVTASVTDGSGQVTSHTFPIELWCSTPAQVLADDEEVVIDPPRLGRTNASWWTYKPAHGFDAALGVLKKVKISQVVSWTFHEGPEGDNYQTPVYFLGPLGYAFVGGDAFSTDPSTTLSKTYSYLQEATPAAWSGDLTFYVASISDATPHHFTQSTTITFLYQPGIREAAFDFTGSDQSFVVPAGCTSVHIDAWGAGGGGGGLLADHNTGSGGAGAYSEASVPVTPGETLTLIVGEGGRHLGGATYGGGGASTGSLSGAGGGRSALRRGADELVTAGGGGGGTLVQAWTGVVPNGGSGGGEAGSDATPSGSAAGRAGGAASGGAGAAGGANGSAFVGGSGGGRHGGGGGGGWFGGGGGGGGLGPPPDPYNGGGGGGSGHAPSGTTLAGAGATPPQTSSPVYRVGAGAGGAPAMHGGPGRVVLTW